jgi:type II secretory pathway pseudopilin PulG
VKPFPISMRRPLGSRKPALRHSREEGYILLTMLLVVALMAIMALVVITEMKFTMQRDQEAEMIHRGVQYSRAIRAYYKKFGRYPTRLEDLDNTNNMRYLRKHYKDPVTGKDFRLLHFGEQGVTVGSGGLSFGGGNIPGANPVGGANGSSPNGSAFGGSSSGGSSFGNSSSSFGNSTFGNSGNSGVNSNGVFAQNSGFGGNSNSAFGGNSNNSAPNSNPPGPNSTNGTDPATASANPQDPNSAKSDATGNQSSGTQSSGQQTFGGGPIVGVASISKKTTIREFNKKKKYNEWQFVYDPTNEPRNGLITTPNQPQLQGFGQQPLNGIQGAQPAGTNNSPFGQSNSFGQSSGFGNNSNSPPPSAPPQVPNPQQPPQ